MGVPKPEYESIIIRPEDVKPSSKDMTLPAAIQGGRHVVWCSTTALKELLMKRQDYYSILGIDRSASGDEVKRVYRVLARRFHPAWH